MIMQCPGCGGDVRHTNINRSRHLVFFECLNVKCGESWQEPVEADNPFWVLTPDDINRIELELHMKFVGDDHDGYVIGNLIKWDGTPWDHEWEADTFSEVIRDVFNELGHRLIKNTVQLTVTFEVP